MHIIKLQFSKTLLFTVFIGFSGLVLANDISKSESQNVQVKPYSKDLKKLSKESGGLRYSLQARYPEYYSKENEYMRDKSTRISDEKKNTPPHKQPQKK